MVEAEALKGAARLEDLHVWVMEKTKTTAKGTKTYTDWMANWREGDDKFNRRYSAKRASRELWEDG